LDYELVGLVIECGIIDIGLGLDVTGIVDVVVTQGLLPF